MCARRRLSEFLWPSATAQPIKPYEQKNAQTGSVVAVDVLVHQPERVIVSLCETYQLAGSETGRLRPRGAASDSVADGLYAAGGAGRRRKCRRPAVSTARAVALFVNQWTGFMQFISPRTCGVPRSRHQPPPRRHIRLETAPMQRPIRFRHLRLLT